MWQRLPGQALGFGHTSGLTAPLAPFRIYPFALDRGFVVDIGLSGRERAEFLSSGFRAVTEQF